VPVIFGSCLVAPIIEECLYRFFIFEVLGKRNIFSYLLSYFTFILAHWQISGDNFVSLFAQYSVAAIGFI
jgi:membrane protease YdiL (CAAX protease family)